MDASQESTVSTCECFVAGDIGSAEPLSEQPGHFFQNTQVVGVWKGGPLDGFLMTAHTAWAYEGGSKGKLVGGIAVARKLGAGHVVFEQGTGTADLSLTPTGMMADWSARATATVKLATGEAAPLQGKQFEWTGKLISPGRFMLEAKAE